MMSQGLLNKTKRTLCAPSRSVRTTPIITSLITREIISNQTSARKFMRSIEFTLKHELTDDRQYLRSCVKKLNFEVQSGETLSGRDWTVKLIEDITVLTLHCCRAQNMADYGIAILNFAKLRTNGPIISTSLINKLEEYARSLFKTCLHVQSFEEHVTDMRSWLQSFQDIRDSVIFEKLYRFAMYAMSLSLFDSVGLSFSKLGYSRMESHALKKQYRKGPSMLHCFADTLLFLCESGFQILKTGSIDSVFHCGRDYERWFKKTLELREQMVHLQEPDQDDYNENQFFKDLEDAIEQGESILRYAARLGRAEKKQVAYKVSDLKMLRSTVMSKAAARKDREPPFSMLIYGDSGIGKSTILSMLFDYFAKLRNHDPAPDNKYTVQPGQKYWNGFQTSQWCIILDDIACENPAKIPGMAETLVEVLRINNQVAYTPDQAAVDDKGVRPLRCKLVLATTNKKDLNAYHSFACPSAVQRRFPYIIRPIPKPEYRDAGGMLDSTKTPPPNGYPDLWDWQVWKVQPQPVDNGRGNALNIPVWFTEESSHNEPHERISRAVPREVFLPWLRDTIIDYYKTQARVKTSLQHIQECVLCDACRLPSSMCECNPELNVQSLEEYTSVIRDVALVGACTYYVASNGFIQYKAAQCASNFIDRLMYVKNTPERIYNKCSNFIGGCKQAYDLSWWRSLGERVRDHIGYPKLLAGIASAIVVGLGILRFSGAVFELQSTEMRVTPRKDEKTDCWYQKEIHLEVSEQVKSSGGNNMLDFHSKVAQSTLFIRSESRPGYTIPGHLLGVGDIYYVGNNHLIPSNGDFYMTIVRAPVSTGVTVNHRFLVSQSQIFRDEARDLCLLKLPQLNPRKSLRGHFVSEKTSGIHVDGSYIIRNEAGDIETVDVLAAHKCDGLVNEGLSEKLPNIQPLDTWKCRTSRPLVYGECGSPMILSTQKGPIIGGVHVASSNCNDAFAIRISTEWLDRAHQHFDTLSVEASVPDLTTPTGKLSVQGLHEKSPFRYLQEGKAVIYGSLYAPRRGMKSNVELTPAVPFLLDHGYEIKYTSGLMSGWKPWRRGLMDLTRPVCDLNASILDECVDSYTQDILSRISEEELSRICVLDDHATHNGLAGVAYLNGINLNTSAGFPINQSKRLWIEPDPSDPDFPDGHKPNAYVQAKRDEIVSLYKRGVLYHPVMKAHLKDEPVTFAKYDIGKTRIFTGAPYPWVLVVRKYLLALIAVIQNNRFIFESAPGTVAQSREWGEIRDYVTQFGEGKIVAGDYKAYDKRMPAQMMMAAFQVIINLCRASPHMDEEDIRVIMCIARDTSYPTVDYHGDLVQFYGSNPSGHPLTVIVNGIANSLYLRYCYRVLNPKQTVSTFKDHVAAMTYGDDNIMGVSDDAPWYNHTTIAGVLGAVDITYTMADKTAESVPYIHIDDASFLKRTWRYDPDFNAYVCPLEHDSIEKMLMVWVRSKATTVKQQMVGEINAATREYAFYGKKTFMKKQSMFAKLITALKLEEYVKLQPLPTYDSLVEGFHKSGRPGSWQRTQQ